MTTLFLALTPAWPTGRSTSEILAGVAWRTSASSGSIVDHRTDPRTGTVSVVIETDAPGAFERVLRERPIPALRRTVGPVAVDDARDPGGPAPVREAALLDFVA